jgi:hypothetical protein
VEAANINNEVVGIKRQDSRKISQKNAQNISFILLKCLVSMFKSFLDPDFAKPNFESWQKQKKPPT